MELLGRERGHWGKRNTLDTGNRTNRRRAERHRASRVAGGAEIGLEEAALARGLSFKVYKNLRATITPEVPRKHRYMRVYMSLCVCTCVWKSEVSLRCCS